MNMSFHLTQEENIPEEIYRNSAKLSVFGRIEIEIRPIT